MTTVRISKKVMAIMGAILLAITFFAFKIPQAQAAPPQAICVPGVTCVTLPPVTVEVPRLVTVRVTLPNATVTVPGAVKTVTRVVTRVVNGSVTRTVTVPIRVTEQIQGPVNTITKTVVGSGPVVNRTVVATQVNTVTVGRNGQATTVRGTVRAPVVSTVTGTPAAITSTQTQVVTAPFGIDIDTPGEVLGFSLLFVVIGAILAGLGALVAYRLGWILGDSGNREFLEDTVSELRDDK